MDINHNLVSGCPYCEIFLSNSSSILYPIDNWDESDFIIVRCKDCNDLLVVVRDHVKTISSEFYGRILYQCRKYLNIPIKASNISHNSEHFSFHISESIVEG